MKQFLILLVLFLVFESCQHSDTENYYIKPGFQGVVTVIYFDTTTLFSGKREFIIPSSGVLGSPLEPTSGQPKLHFYYGYDKSGTALQLNIHNDTSFEDVRISDFVTGQAESDNSRTSVQFVQFIVSDAMHLDQCYLEKKKINVGNIADSLLHK